MLNEKISISHNLVRCSDNEIIEDWKNGLGMNTNTHILIL